MPASYSQFIGSTPVSMWQVQQEWSATTKLCIRAAQAADLEAMAELLTGSFHQREGLLGWAYPLLKFGIQEDLRTRLRSGDSHRLCLVAVEQSKIPGVSSLAPRLEPNAAQGEFWRSLTAASLGRHCLPGDAFPSGSSYPSLMGTVELGPRHPLLWYSGRRQLYLSNLAVACAYRRRGVAQSLLRACEEIARDWGFSELYLHVLENNLAARRLYRKLGYRLEQVDCGLSQWLLAQPRQFLLKKTLGSRT